MKRPWLLLAMLCASPALAEREVPVPPPSETAPAEAVPSSGAPSTTTTEPPSEAPVDVLADDPILARDPDAVPPPTLGVGELVGSFARTMLMLLLVLGLVYLTLQKGVGKLVQRNQIGKRMRVVERVGLDPRRTLYIVDVDGREMLIGTGEGGMVHLRDLGEAKEPTVASAPAAKAKVARPFAKALDAVHDDKSEQDETKEGAA